MTTRPVFRASLLLASTLLAGCATGPTHDSRVGVTMAAASQGNLDSALNQIDNHVAGADKADLLLNLEKGELLRIGGHYRDSLTAFELADRKVAAWEETAKSNPAMLMGQVTALFAGDAARTYEGQDYEKVMLTTRMALDRISLGDLDTARVDIKRTHEREAVIAAFRARETAAAEQEARDKGVQPGTRELNGYPVETLNDPEVLKLRNGYQNALSHYLAGFVYEALNEPGLAAPGYRKAIELRPDLPVLEEGLRGLDGRTGFRHKPGATDVLFIIESGNAPARLSQKASFAVQTRKGLINVSLAFPVIYPDRNAQEIGRIEVDDIVLPTALVTDFNVMARKALKDELPGMQLRSAARALGRGLLQDQANKTLGAFAGLVGNLVATATDVAADDRLWRALPGRVFIARAAIAPGSHSLRVPGQPDGSMQLDVRGRTMLVPVRVFRNKTYFGKPVVFGDSGVMAAGAVGPAMPAVPAVPALQAAPIVPVATVKPAGPAVVVQRSTLSTLPTEPNSGLFPPR